MCAEGLIDTGDLEAWLSAAESRGDVESKALLLRCAEERRSEEAPEWEEF